MKFKLFVILCSISVASLSFAQEKTELEKFSAKTGVVTIMGYTDIGSILTDPSYPKEGIFLQKRILGTPNNPATKKGILIKVSDFKGNSGRSFIDEKEIDDLIAGLGYLSSVTKDITTLENFEVTYETVGGFNVTAYSSGGTIKFLAKAGNKQGSMTAEHLKGLVEDLKEVKY
jgi:hypothetical protein